MRLWGIIHGLVRHSSRLQHSVQRFSGIINRSSGYIMYHASCFMTKYTRTFILRPRSLENQRPSSTAQSSSKHTRSIIHHPSPIHHPLHALLELQMCLVLFYIILPILLTSEFHHKGVRKTWLLSCQLAALHHEQSHKSEGYTEGMVRDRVYFVGLWTILPPAGACRDVGFLGCRVDALVAEFDEVIACLLVLAKCSRMSMQRDAYTSWIFEGSSVDLN